MVGQHIGKYRVTEQIGRGGMGTVYRALDETLHREVAVKVLNAELSDPTVAKRFRAEAVTVARLNHPGIATIYELLQHDGQWLMVMEFLRGETLESLVARTGALPVARAADLVMQTLAALSHAHGLGVVHRDLKPANLMLADNGLVKVMDFGIARVAGGEQLTSVGFMMGTPAYMAPEQVLGNEIDARTDLYAMGLVFYHLVTGQLPFGGRTPLEQAQARIQDPPTPIRTARPDLPGWVAEVVDLALSRAPERRFQTAAAFRDAIAQGLANLPIQAPGRDVAPPELVVTAAPGSLAVLPPSTGSSGAVRREGLEPSSPVAAVGGGAFSEQRPAAMGERHVQPVEPPAPARGGMPMAALAAGVVLLAVGGWWIFGRSAPPPPTAVPAVEAPSAVAPPPVSPPAAPPAPVAATNTPPAAGTPAPASPAAVPGKVDPAAAAPGRGDGRGRGAPVAETVMSFKDVRAFLVSGRNVEERDALLTFGDGRVSLTDPRGQRQFGTMAYADITAVAHSRGDNPRWYPTLAAPPANLNMPGGIFRSERHWLVFQSRSTFLIARINDNDYRRVIETANARLKVRAETLTK